MGRGNSWKVVINARKNVDDEFYTTKEHVEFVFNNYLKDCDFSGKIIYLPCDSDESEFTKYLKDNKLRYNYKELIYTSDDWMNHKDLFDKSDYVITNPPFSRISKDLRYLLSDFKGKFFFFGCNYVISSYYDYFHCFDGFHIIDKVNSGEYRNKRIEYTFKNTDKTVHIIYFTNIKEAKSLKENNIYTGKFSDLKEPQFCKVLNKDIYYLNVDKIRDIPLDYDKEILVPVSILYDHNIYFVDIIDTDVRLEREYKKFRRCLVKIKDEYLMK